jgi:hypothetical protein
MKRFILAYILVTVLLILLCSCAMPATTIAQYSYTAVNTTQTAVTNKSIPDHALSYVTQADCNIFNLFEGLYYCEERDISKTYNRSGI